MSELFPIPEGPESLSEAELLALLTERVGTLLEQQPELLMSLLYRMDVEESAILKAMHPNATEPAHIGLAQLVLERQRQRSATKRSVQVTPLDDWKDWTW
jgi:DNA repair protein RadC